MLQCRVYLKAACNLRRARTALPDNLFSALVQLAGLSVQRAQLQHFQPHLFPDQFPSLMDLQLAGNKLAQVPQETLSRLPSLRYLDLSHNPIDTLPKLRTLSQVETLLLNGCNLRRLSADTFTAMTNLRHLQLSSNLLEDIDVNAFQANGGPAKLSSVYLMGNSLRSIPEATLQWSSLERLALEGNPWTCDCQMRWARDAWTHVQMDRNETTCREPARLRGRTLMSITSSDFTCADDNDGLSAVSVVIVLVLLLVVASAALALALLPVRGSQSYGSKLFGWGFRILRNDM